jgi:hypothetical protein
MNKFEQLIEFVINDEEAKARELFHDIVVEKSRQIYEEMMAEESAEDEDDKAEKAGEKVTKDIEYDDKEDKKVDEGMGEALGGDQADDLIDDIEVEEEGLPFEGDGDEEMADDEMADDEMADAELEDRVVDLEDKLDELMAEFESLMNNDAGTDDTDTDMDMEVDTDDGMTDIEVSDDELETEGYHRMPMEENVSLKAAPAPVKSEEAGINKKAVVAANSGARGAVAKPVHATGDGGTGRPAPTAKEAIGRVGNTPAQSTQEPKPAAKPHLAQATGVNTKSPLPRQ